MTTATTTPAFVLRRIDFQAIQKNFLEGLYSHVTKDFIAQRKREQPETHTVVFSATSQPPPVKHISSYMDAFRNQQQKEIDLGTPLQETFKTKDHLSHVSSFVTTNHTAFEYFAKNGEILPEGGVCEWDRHPFAHRRCGVPLSHQLLTGEKGETKHVIHLDGETCSWQCALALLMRDRGLPSRFRNAGYMDSEQILQYIWKVLYQNENVLEEAGHYRLIKPYGPLTIEEYRSHLTQYKDEQWLIYAPVKHVFRKKDS